MFSKASQRSLSAAFAASADDGSVAMAASVAAIGIAMAAGAVATGGAVNSLSHCLAVLRLHPHRRAAPDMVDANSGFCWNWTNASALVSRRRARTLMERASTRPLSRVFDVMAALPPAHPQRPRCGRATR